MMPYSAVKHELQLLTLDWFMFQAFCTLWKVRQEIVIHYFTVWSPVDLTSYFCTFIYGEKKENETEIEFFCSRWAGILQLSFQQIKFN